VTEGTVTTLYEDVYRRLSAERSKIVLLGGPGAGKTAAMTLLLIDCLEHRAAAAAGDRDGRPPAGQPEPVPVWLALGSWNPASMSLLAWAEITLRRDFPGLNRAADTAGSLLRSGRVALFLDGLDEMPEKLRGPALETIDREAAEAGLRIVLTSRPDEYRQALVKGRLYGAAVVQILPMTPGEVESFLTKDEYQDRRVLWQQVITQMKLRPDGAAARTLTTPLALTLARETYRTAADGNPEDMLDETVFADPGALLGHLFGRFLHHAYPDQGARDHAVRWLSWLAESLGQVRDVAWWDLPALVPRQRFLIVRGVVIGLVGLLVVTPTYGLLGWYGRFRQFAWPGHAGIAFAGGRGLALGLFVGILGAIGSGLASGSLESPVAPTRALQATTRWRRLTAGLGRNFRAWLKVGIGFASLMSTVAAVILAALAWANPKLPPPVITELVVGSADVVLYVAVVFGFWAWRRLRIGLLVGAAVLILSSVIAECAPMGPPVVLALTLAAAIAVGIPFYGVIVGVNFWVSLTVVYPFLFRLLLLWRRPFADSPAATPLSTYRTDRRACLIADLIIGFGIVLAEIGSSLAIADRTYALAVGSATGLVLGTVIGLTAGPAPATALTSLTLAVTGRGRVRLMRLLIDAHKRQLLRQVGPVYQFRHAELQDYLAGLAHPPTHPSWPGWCPPR